ncbi:hypothetical protein G6F46_011352 [Rhizopus delemar]|uniref:Uncharacterized protein n=2 Tax=Rhizopus TaxID=4842 RepID=A0A9P6YTK7_9FUNG|nr:hypothetical protein G6F55_011620 [Rhizopus delemar]KAG1535601.1 hypothetical protein G6F51_011448 [Rhizopus arrhizus]KAG1488774.1 hypothetical protein G6F54_011888 [Rhizopus delemar]KAG1501388.1 hypothetical protein G6F53_011094 [Rhizopus delemar]KAG1509579.1 hypothetical protein G6F52_011106 [Rhizopus delemar]
MSDIENVEHQGQQQEQTLLYTRDDVAKILKEFDRQREEQRESIYRGIQLPEQIREILDETPTADLKDDIKRFKRNVPKYNHNEWTRTPQINKEFINELKKWKVDTHQVVTSIIKHAEEARFQARTSTEIFEILESIEGKCTLEGEESRQLFFNAMAQASRAAVCGFAHARDLDQEAKEYSTKTSMMSDSTKGSYQEQQITTIEEEVFPTEVMVVEPDLSTNLSLDIFSPEDEAVEPSDPLRSISSSQTITQTILPPTNSAETFKSADQGITDNTTQESRTMSTYYSTTQNTIYNTTYYNTIISSGDTTKTIEPKPPNNKGDTEDNFTSLAVADSQRRLPITVHLTSSSLENSSSPNQQVGPIREELGSTKILNSRNHRRKQGPSFLKPIPFKLLYYPGTDEKKIDPRLQKIEPIYTSSTLQDGGDLKDAYMVVPIHANSRPFLAFKNLGVTYTYRALNFGLNTAPRIFSKLLRYALEPLRKEGVRLFRETNYPSPRILRLHYKQGKKRANTPANSGLFGIHFQHKEDDNKSTRKEDTKPKTEVEAGCCIHTTNKVNIHG